MKKQIRISLFALALAGGIGGAFATSNSSGNAEACTGNELCSTEPQFICCVDYSNPEEPAEVRGQKLN